jgi:hypothetical protein
MRTEELEGLFDLSEAFSHPLLVIAKEDYVW